MIQPPDGYGVCGGGTAEITGAFGPVVVGGAVATLVALEIGAIPGMGVVLAVWLVAWRARSRADALREWGDSLEEARDHQRRSRERVRRRVLSRSPWLCPASDSTLEPRVDRTDVRFRGRVRRAKPYRVPGFFELSPGERADSLRELPLPTQLDIYTEGIRHVRPAPISLAYVIAENGEPAVDPVLDRAGNESDPHVRAWLLYILSVMHCHRADPSRRPEIARHIADMANGTRNENARADMRGYAESVQRPCP